MSQWRLCGVWALLGSWRNEDSGLQQVMWPPPEPPPPNTSVFIPAPCRVEGQQNRAATTATISCSEGGTIASFDELGAARSALQG